MANRYYAGPPSDHFDGRRFFHPGLPTSDKSFAELLRWRLQGKRAPWPKEIDARSGLQPSAYVADLQITAIGHASLLVQAAGMNILIDPVFATRASPFRVLGPRRRNPPAVAFEDLPPIHAVLVTHNHYDHMDTQFLARLWRARKPYVLSPLGNDRVIRAAAPEVRVTTGDWWDAFTLPGGLRATIVPSYHWSARRFADRRMALWGGFVLETPAGAVYLAGDTAYREEGKLFREIDKRFGPPAVAALPIGACAPRWFMARQHANPEEAVQIARDCRARHTLGIHWGTFPLTDEPWDEPPRRFRQAAAGDAEIIAFGPGDTWQLPAV